MDKLVGIYLSTDVVNEDPGYLDVLQREIGLSHVLLSARAVRLSPATLALNPFAGQPDPREVARDLVCRGLDGEIYADLDEARAEQAGRGPAVTAGDDTGLVRAIATCKARGLTPWYVGAAWTANSLMYCPSKERVNAWLEAVYTDVARTYDVGAIDITHARYPKFSFVETLFQCACPDCARAAGELGYDLPRIVSRLGTALERIGHLAARDLATAAREPLGALDLIQALPELGAWGEWLGFRCDLLTRNLQRFRWAVRATERPVRFASDTYPPALAALVGHRYRDWPGHSDFYSPLLSHIFAFITQGFASWTRFLRARVADLSEADALGLLYRLSGYDGLGMPETLAGLGLERPDGEFWQVPIAGLMERDLAKSRLYASREIPSYPIIQGGVWPPEVVRQLIDAAEQCGHDGIIFQGTGSLVNYPGRG